MKDHRDAYGQELYSLYQGEDRYEIIEREDGHVEAGDATGYLASYEDWPPSHRKAIKYVRGDVLDVGCGAGRLALYLQRKGHRVLGMDISPLAAKVCKLRGLKSSMVMSITEVSSKLGTFDTIIMMGSNFGLFGSLKRARWLLARFHNLTTGKGRIVAETRDPSHLAYHKSNRKRGRMSGQVKIRVRFRKVVGKWFDYLFVSKDELTQILDGTGWTVRRFIDSKGPAYIAVIDKVPRE